MYKKQRTNRKNCLSVSISFPIDLLDEVDEKSAELNFTSRSDFIISIIKEKLQTK